MAKEMTPEEEKAWRDARKILDEHFKEIYNREVKQYEFDHTSLHTAILNHGDIRSHCWEVSKQLLEIALKDKKESI
jgi:hypothetical protein